MASLLASGLSLAHVKGEKDEIKHWWTTRVAFGRRKLLNFQHLDSNMLWKTCLFSCKLSKENKNLYKIQTLFVTLDILKGYDILTGEFYADLKYQ